MAKNGPITKTTWTDMAAGDKVTAANITELQTAIAALEGYAKNVDNCGFTNFCQKCQACQGCQSTSCQRCQLYNMTNCSDSCSDDS